MVGISTLLNATPRGDLFVLFVNSVVHKKYVKKIIKRLLYF